MLYQYHKKDHYEISYDSETNIINYNTIPNGKLYPDQEASYIENLVGTSIFEFFFHYWGEKYRDELLEKFDGIDSGTLRLIESTQSRLIYRCQLYVDIPEKIHKYHGNEEIRSGSMSDKLKSQTKSSWYNYHIYKKGRQHRPVKHTTSDGVTSVYSSAKAAAHILGITRHMIYAYINGRYIDKTGVWEYIPEEELGKL